MSREFIDHIHIVHRGGIDVLSKLFIVDNHDNTVLITKT